MSMNITRRRITRDQSGMVSILVTLILMLVISLIVIGFAQVSRREQRESLDRQLSTQAFFAAESAVNDARQIALAALAAGNPVPDKLSCQPDPNYPLLTANPSIDGPTNVSYPCLLVTAKVKDILLNPVTALGDSINMPIEPVGGMDKLHLIWDAPGQSQPVQQSAVATGCSGAVVFPKSGSWTCPYGVLRIDFVPTTVLSRQATVAGQKTVFFYPTQGGGTPALAFGAAATNGAVAPMKCVAAGGCTIDVTGISGKYAVRVSSIYVSGTLDISAFNGATQQELQNAQIKVDATGKAQDVLRRIQVRLPLIGSGQTPDYALESGGSICKRFEFNATAFKISGIFGQDQTNPMCQASSVSPPAPFSATGDALVVNFCDLNPNSCTGGLKDPGRTPRWTATIQNKSNNPPANVVGCQWNLDDGLTPAQNGLTNKYCQYGDSFTYKFPALAGAKICQDVLDNGGKTRYDVTVTIFLNNGSTIASPPKSLYVPANC